ncbi:CaiB/BaiF CoA transferase family protein [Pseudomonas nitroreducens]|uniref:CaiB/BaiF CoA transferase family protein n=1 Tax=Pseudomonas nitroreducens TaxID=46680 RepID=UPI00209F76D3|nr:CaiB/BaiF CoA-transferase family protein [Pseudomonas nitroreducens]MCP1625157.1 crotonobetainyl-CoA:carnitine CoA-transferase CaiB-like acyl-CoA transferase [Pseudomonas nitroreducens]
MSNTQATPQGPLAGLRVLDLSRVLAGPWATQILGDLGADVIKVERPSRRDDTRTWGPPFLEDSSPTWDAAYYFCANRNKRAIAVDFGHPDGAALLRRLATSADVLVENYKVGTLARYGLDYAALKALNPKLIYCSVTGFGQTGPYAGRGGYDFLVQGMSGLMSITGRRDDEPGAGPLKVGLPVSDLFCGLYATISILAALNHRHASGEGQHIDCALLDSQLSLMANQAMNHLVSGQVPQRLGNAHPNVVPYRDFACNDDYILVACGSDGQFQALCRLLDRDDLGGDPRFTRNPGRSQHRRELEVELARSIAGWQAADLLAAMEKAGVPGGPINNLQQALADPQVQARGLLQTLTRQDGTEVTLLGYPARFSASPPTYRLAPPMFAQDTAQVLAEQLGLATEQLTELAGKGAIALAQPLAEPVSKVG